MVYNNILETIGNTPLIRLNKVAEEVPARVFAKVEAFNPGHSAKDRIALYMIEQAEKSGNLKPGDTIVEATSGNTGFSLAMVARLRGYKCILTVSSKASKAKINMLLALGAKVVTCPAGVAADDSRSYYSRAKQIAAETPNAYYMNQNFNLDNSGGHYHSTGPEIWRQTDGKITHLVVCAGTGGTLSGTARYLKDQNKNIKIIAVDAEGSVLKKYFETGIFDENEIHPYQIEGLGKTIIPANIDFDVIDEFVKVNDKDSALTARKLAADDGIFVGYSSGAAMQAILQIKDRFKPSDVIVTIFSDHGSRYVGKIFNDEWMEKQGFFEKEEANLINK